MRIANVICTYQPYRGGMGNSAGEIAKALAGRCHEVRIITPDYGSIGDSSQDGIFIERLKPFFRFGNAAFLPQIFFRLDGFDIVHLHYPFFGTACIVLLRKIFAGDKMKLVLHYHMDAVSAGLKGLIFRVIRMVLLPQLVRYSDSIVCSSFDYARHSDLGRHFASNEGKFSEIPFGVDLKRFSGDDEEEADEGGGEERYALFVGGLDKAHYFKGLEVLIRAFALAAKDREYYLSIVGSGDLYEKYASIVSGLGLASKVKFFGSVSDKELPGYYLRSDCLVLPSINKGEAFGLVLLEAMASGRAVIASDLPGVRTVFEDGKQGLLVRPGDIDDLADKLRSLLSDGKRLFEMGRAGRALAREKYTWEKCAHDLERIYEKISV